MPQNKDKAGSFDAIVITVLFIVTFFSRFFVIGKGLFHPDSIMLMARSQTLADTGQLHGYLTGYSLPVILGAFFIQAGRGFGADATASINLLSVVCGAAAVAVFYALCLRLFDRMTAIICSAMFFSLPHLFSMSTFANSQIVALVFVLLGFFALSGDRGKGSMSLLLAAVFFGLLGASRPQELFFLAPLIFFVLMSGLVKEKVMPLSAVRALFTFWAIVALIIVLVPLPFLFYAGTIPSAERFQALYVSYPSSGSYTWGYLARMFFFSLMVLLAEFKGVFLLSILGASFLFNRHKPLFTFMLLWFLGVFIGYTLLFPKTNPSTRYCLLSFIPVVICAGYAIRSLYEPLFLKPAWRCAGIFLTCFILLYVVSFSMGQISAVVYFRHKNSVAEDFGRWVGHLTPFNAIVIGGDERDFVDVYGHRKTEGVNFLSDEFFAKIQKHLQDGHPLFIILFRHEKAVPKVFEENGYHLAKVGQAPFELWAQATASLQIFDETLYRIEKSGTK